MTKITIRNNFTNLSTTVDTSEPLTVRRIKNIRRRLCSTDCMSGDALGARGPQDDPVAYAALWEEASRVIFEEW